MKSVIIIGGGLAGLSAAAALTDAGVRVRLLEKRPHLGGRATSYDLPDGAHVDNCQHVTLGCCTNLADFYERAGAGGKIRFYDRLFFFDRDGRRGVIKSSSLPAPLHLAPSFLLFPSLTFADKRGIARTMLRIARARGLPAVAGGPDNPASISMLDWLRREGQTPPAIEKFWRVVLVSALDEELDRADARYGVEVFWKAFLANRRGFEIGIPSVPLAELYDGCHRAIMRKGGEVRTRSSVRALAVENGRVTGVILPDGAKVAADAYILAVPHDAVAGLLPEALVQSSPALRGLAELRVSPITGVHFWLDRPVLAEPFVTLLDQTVQWVFNKTLLYASHSPLAANHSQQYLQLVISASYGLVPLSRQQIIALCWRELQQVLPAAQEAQLVRATVVKETSATFSPAPGCDRLRPGVLSPLENLFLAGDWTATGWPATMEGAVRSGYRAAEEVASRLGSARKFLKEDLPLEGLARGWFWA